MSALPSLLDIVRLELPRHDQLEAFIPIRAKVDVLATLSGDERVMHLATLE